MEVEQSLADVLYLAAFEVDKMEDLPQSNNARKKNEKWRIKPYVNIQPKGI